MNKYTDEHIEFLVWFYTLGQSQRDIRECRILLEEIINMPDFDVTNPKDKIVKKVLRNLVYLETHLEP